MDPDGHFNRIQTESMELFELPEFNENFASERRLEALEEQLRVSEQVLTSNHLF